MFAGKEIGLESGCWRIEHTLSPTHRLLSLCARPRETNTSEKLVKNQEPHLKDAASCPNSLKLAKIPGILPQKQTKSHCRRENRREKCHFLFFFCRDAPRKVRGGEKSAAISVASKNFVSPNFHIDLPAIFRRCMNNFHTHRLAEGLIHSGNTIFHTISPNFPRNCIKIRTPKILRPSDVVFPKKTRTSSNNFPIGLLSKREYSNSPPHQFKIHHIRDTIHPEITGCHQVTCNFVGKSCRVFVNPLWSFVFLPCAKMLDLFTIFTKGGIVLWCFRGTNEIFAPSVNALIRSVILQVSLCPCFSLTKTSGCIIIVFVVVSAGTHWEECL